MQPGRPTKFTPEVRAALIEMVEQGVPFGTASEACGIDYQTLRRWIKRGESLEGQDSEFAQFCDALRRARSRGASNLIRKINTAPDWRAAAWLLERSYQGRWQPASKVEQTHKGKPGQPVEVKAAVEATYNADFVAQTLAILQTHGGLDDGSKSAATGAEGTKTSSITGSAAEPILGQFPGGGEGP